MAISWNVILNLLLKDFLLPLFVAFIDFLFLFLRPEWIFFFLYFFCHSSWQLNSQTQRWYENKPFNCIFFTASSYEALKTKVCFET